MTRPAADGQVLQQALALFRQGQFAAAAGLLRELLARQPRHFDALHVLALIETQLQRPDAALATFEEAAAIQPRHAMLQFNRGMLLQGLGRSAEALQALDLALAAQPGYPRAIAGRTSALVALGRIDEAQAALAAAIAAQPADTTLYLEQGNLFYQTTRYEEARASFERAVELQPANADAWVNLGSALIKLGRHEPAVDALDRAIAAGGGLADAHFNRGIALAALSRHEGAVESFGRALAISPGLTGAWRSRGFALAHLKQHAAALVDFDRALQLSPDDAQAHFGRAGALYGMGRVEEAINSYERALALDPQLDFALDLLLQARMYLCDWRDFDRNLALLEQRIAAGKMVAPTALFAVSNSAALQRIAAERYATSKFPSEPLLPEPQPRRDVDRIRIGYFSSDFYAHATAYLMAGLFEKHDRSRFEIVAFSFGAAREDAMRVRLRAAFDRFVDVGAMSDRAVVELARELEIDIAVDLKGLTQDARPRVFAMRAAPAQVAFLGYPMTLGATFMDYLVADRTVIAHPSHYTEKILYMPHSYQVNDDTRLISPNVPSRPALGLPERGFVFCCHNISYKITPPVFDVWMRLLMAVDSSVLWLIDGGEAVARNLRREAQASGVAADRLIFAPRVELADHLARQQAADLFLDTFPCNAHTTASDALWAGLPLLTCTGETFASRVSASLLNAVGLPELVTHSLEDYEALALALARDRPRLADLRQRLAVNRRTQPLFDTPLFARHLEAGYAMILARLQAGLPPDHLVVDRTATA